MHTKALIQSDSLRIILIASLAPALVAILHIHGRPVIANAHNPVVFHNNRPNCPFHAVRPCTRSVRDLHEVVVDVRPELPVEEIAQLGHRVYLL